MNIRKPIIILVHALLGWALWVAAMLIYGRGTISCYGWCFVFSTTLLPLFFVILSLIYFKKFNYTTPFLTAILFTGFLIVGFLVVELLLGSLNEFARTFENLWISLALIFVSTYLTGVLTLRNVNSNVYSALKSIQHLSVGFFVARNPDSKIHKNAVVAISAIISAIGSGVFGIFIGAWGWGLWENASVGVFPGLVVGLIVGIRWPIKLMTEGYASWKAIIYSLLMALLISGLFVVVTFLLLEGLP